MKNFVKLVISKNLLPDYFTSHKQRHRYIRNSLLYLVRNRPITFDKYLYISIIVVTFTPVE